MEIKEGVLRQTHFKQEYAELRQRPLEGIQISLVAESDMHKWEVVIAGPKDSPYAVREPSLRLTWFH